MTGASESARLTRFLPWLLVIGGLAALVSSIVLSVEKLNLLQDPEGQAVCDLNPIFSCTSVTASSQASAFGIPNPFLGIAGYAAVIAIGAGLLAGARFRRWFWLALNTGLLLTGLFIHWLIFAAVYGIGALCLFCMIVWAVTIPMLWYVTLYNLREGHIFTPRSLKRVVAFAGRHHGDILIVWFLLIAVLILTHFWYYWNTLI